MEPNIRHQKNHGILIFVFIQCFSLSSKPCPAELDGWERGLIKYLEGLLELLEPRGIFIETLNC